MPEEAVAPESTEPVTDSADLARLTQDEVDRVVESRLARERRKFSDYDELQEKANAYDEAVLAGQSELEQYQTHTASLEQEVAELADANAYVAARSGLLAEVAKPEHGIVDPEGALEFLLGADQDFVEFEDDGTPLNAAEAVELLKQKRSYLVSAETSPRSNADQGARGGQRADQLSEADLQNMTPQAIVKARNEGRLDDVLAGKR